MHMILYSSGSLLPIRLKVLCAVKAGSTFFLVQKVCVHGVLKLF